MEHLCESFYIIIVVAFIVRTSFQRKNICLASFYCIQLPIRKSAKILNSLKTFIIRPIDLGGVEALISNSTAYQHLSQTNIASYSIVGIWTNATESHNHLERLFQKIIGNSNFSLDKNGFYGPNDLHVRLDSQDGSINSVVRPNGNSAIPKGNEIYPNTVHAQNFIADYGIDYEIGSHKIANDVIALLDSPSIKFSHSIGNSTHCNSQ